MIQPKPVTWSLHATRIFKTCWSQLRILVFGLGKGLNTLVPCLHPRYTCHNSTCVQLTDAGQYVHVMSIGWSSFDNHEAVCVLWGKNDDSKVPSSFHSFPRIFQSCDSRLKSSLKTGHHNVVGWPLPVMNKNTRILYWNTRYESESNK